MLCLKMTLSENKFKKMSLTINIPFNEYFKFSSSDKKNVHIIIYNDIDATCYTISYYKNTEIYESDITKRIVSDVIRHSLSNTTRSKGLNFSDAKFETLDNFKTVRVYNNKETKPFGYLNTCCTICTEIN